MVLVPADVGGVAQELQRIDRSLKLRYSERQDYWAVYTESDDGRETHLVLTAKECDHRIVKRVQEIDSHGRSGYDYAQALEHAALERRRLAKQRFDEQVGEAGELAAHAVRKDLGLRYKGRIFT